MQDFWWNFLRYSLVQCLVFINYYQDVTCKFFGKLNMQFVKKLYYFRKNGLFWKIAALFTKYHPPSGQMSKVGVTILQMLHMEGVHQAATKWPNNTLLVHQLALLSFSALWFSIILAVRFSIFSALQIRPYGSVHFILPSGFP